MRDKMKQSAGFKVSRETTRHRYNPTVNWGLGFNVWFLFPPSLLPRVCVYVHRCRESRAAPTSAESVNCIIHSTAG